MVFEKTIEKLFEIMEERTDMVEVKFNRDSNSIDVVDNLGHCSHYKKACDSITRSRLEELATLFKDGLIIDDKDSAMEYFDSVCEMTPEEKEWFGIQEGECE